MLEDDRYNEIGLSNRGNATEEIAFDLLKQVFGTGNVYRGVNVWKGKNLVTDIDVLAVGGNKAIVVQAKSKKLTVSSRRGEGGSLRRDFQDGVQQAYKQALFSRNALLERGTSLTVGQGQSIRLEDAIDDAYLICVTGDHYPAVMTHLNVYLQKTDSDPYPLAMSIFDLDILSFYLSDPFDLLYYLRQRSNYATNFIADSEMALLGYHLSQKLFPPKEADLCRISPEYAQLIDANFQVARGDHPHTEAADRLFHQWKNEAFDQLVNDVKTVGHPQRSDILFFLFDLAGVETDKLFKAFEQRKNGTLRDRQIHGGSAWYPQDKRGNYVHELPADDFR